MGKIPVLHGQKWEKTLLLYMLCHLPKPTFWRNKQCHPRSAVFTRLWYR